MTNTISKTDSCGFNVKITAPDGQVFEEFNVPIKEAGILSVAPELLKALKWLMKDINDAADTSESYENAKMVVLKSYRDARGL